MNADTSNQCSELQISFCIGLEQSRLAKAMLNLLRFFLMILRAYNRIILYKKTFKVEFKSFKMSKYKLL